MVVVRAIYRDGKFQPLESVDLQDGQEVQLQIVGASETVRDLVGDMLASFESGESDFDAEEVQRQIDEALKGKRPLSEIIIEERRTGR